MKTVSIVIPAYNEVEALPLLYERLTGVIDRIADYRFKVLLVDDGSTDGTRALIERIRGEDRRFSALHLSRNFGKEAAMLAGLDYAEGDAVILMDADLQDPPELIPKLLAAWEQGYDDVYARSRRTRAGEGWLKKWSSTCYYRVLERFSSAPVQRDTGDFRLFDRRCVLALRKLREAGRCSKSLFGWIGYRKKEVLFDREPRVAGRTKWNYGRLFQLAVDGITALSTAPLRWISLAGFAVMGGFLVYLLSLVIGLALTGSVSPAQIVVLVLLFLGGLQLGTMGILAEYLARAFQNGKNRPIYLVDCYNGVKETNEHGQSRELSHIEGDFRKKETDRPYLRSADLCGSNTAAAGGSQYKSVV